MGYWIGEQSNLGRTAGLGYLLRSQDDFRDVFHLRKFAAAHSDWKPFLAHVLGFDAQLIVEHYEKKSNSKKQAIAQTIKNELGGSIEDISKIEGILLLKQKEAEKNRHCSMPLIFVLRIRIV
jgi:uncharacterized protein YydD (DUF2326 family)